MLLLPLFSSILNKLTPEKFDKLCLELLNVGVDSKLILKGIILLVSVHSILMFISAQPVGCTLLADNKALSFLPGL